MNQNEFDQLVAEQEEAVTKRVNQVGGVPLKVSGEDLTGLDLRAADWMRAEARGTIFRQALMQGVQAERIEAPGAIFVGVKAAGANFYDSNLNGTDWTDADLPGSNLRMSRRQGAIFKDARTDGAKIDQPPEMELAS